MKKNFIDKIVDLFGKIKCFKPLLKLYYKHRQIWLYLFFGVCTTLINIFSYDFFANVINIEFLTSNILAWFVALIFAYVVNKFFVFTDAVKTKSVIKEMVMFGLTRTITLFIDLLIMYVGYKLLSFDDLLVKIAANIIVIIVNYIFGKLVIFKEKK